MESYSRNNASSSYVNISPCTKLSSDSNVSFPDIDYDVNDVDKVKSYELNTNGSDDDDNTKQSPTAIYDTDHEEIHLAADTDIDDDNNNNNNNNNDDKQDEDEDEEDNETTKIHNDNDDETKEEREDSESSSSLKEPSFPDISHFQIHPSMRTPPIKIPSKSLGSTFSRHENLVYGNGRGDLYGPSPSLNSNNITNLNEICDDQDLPISIPRHTLKNVSLYSNIAVRGGRNDGFNNSHTRILHSSDSLSNIAILAQSNTCCTPEPQIDFVLAGLDDADEPYFSSTTPSATPTQSNDCNDINDTNHISFKSLKRDNFEPDKKSTPYISHDPMATRITVPNLNLDENFSEDDTFKLAFESHETSNLDEVALFDMDDMNLRNIDDRKNNNQDHTVSMHKLIIPTTLTIDVNTTNSGYLGRHIDNQYNKFTSIQQIASSSATSICDDIENEHEEEDDDDNKEIESTATLSGHTLELSQTTDGNETINHYQPQLHHIVSSSMGTDLAMDSIIFAADNANTLHANDHIFNHRSHNSSPFNLSYVPKQIGK